MAFLTLRRRRVLLGVSLTGALLLSLGADVAPTLASTILARALAYDKTLSMRAGEAVVVAVVRPPAEPACDGMLQGFRDLEKVTLAGLPFRAMEVPFTSAASLENLPAAGVDALFLCSGLETSLSAITAYSRRAKLLTLSSTPGYVEGGVSLGAVMEGGKPRLLVNLAASKLEGAQFSSDMMKLAKVIR